MQIRTKLRLNTWISAGTFIILIVAVTWALGESSKTYQDLELVDELRKVAAERVMLRDDYLLHREERAKIQWLAKSEILRGLLDRADARFVQRNDKALLKEARQSFEATFTSFSGYLDRYKLEKQAVVKTQNFTDAEARLIGQVFLKAYALSDNIMQLHAATQKKAKTARERVSIIVILFIMGGIVAVIFNTAFVSSLLRRKIGALASGMEIIGNGNLDYRIEATGNDELAGLARAGNAMAAKLKTSYTSMENLEQEIIKRQRMENNSLQKSRLLKAINNVFYEAMIAESTKDIARTCLSMALELTDSEFGFIGEITKEGLFSTTVLSDPGWEACRIPETKGTKMITDMTIRGIWGDVLLREQSLIVNDPAGYPGRAGLPLNHPPLTSFLGAPLKDKGKTIGMIAVANRQGGYTDDLRQYLEALTVAFVESIRRKEAEETIRRMNTELEQRVRERTTELSAKNAELIRLNNIFVDRELRMRELKAKIKELERT